MDKWVDDIEKCRSRYDDLRAIHLNDDKRNNYKLDPRLNNPLSTEAESPWNQFFIDSELKKVIERVSEKVLHDTQIGNRYLLSRIIFFF